MTDATLGGYTVPVRYVPKSVWHEKRYDGTIRVQMKASNPLVLVTGLAAIFFVFRILPFLLFFVGMSGGVLLFLIAVGIPLSLHLKGLPDMHFSPEGVRIGGNFYPMSDVADFREGADDSWLAQVIRIGGMEFLGLQYGIYSVRTPYMLPKIESLKVAPYLTELLKSLDVEVGTERARKIQQAEVF